MPPGMSVAHMGACDTPAITERRVNRHLPTWHRAVSNPVARAHVTRPCGIGQRAVRIRRTVVHDGKPDRGKGQPVTDHILVKILDEGGG